MAGSAGCPAHPEWAGLVCQTTTGETTASVPVDATTAYTLWGDAKTQTETKGSTVRTTTTTFDPAGRPTLVHTAVAGLSGSTPVDDTFTHYSSTTGAVDYSGTQNPSTHAETGRVSTGYDAWGRTIAYTDGNGVVTSTTYAAPGANGAGSVSSESTKNAAQAVVSSTAYTYDSSGNTTKQGTTIGSRSFTYGATYDTVGDMVTQTLPGGVTQTNAYSRDGQPTGMEYDGTAADGSSVAMLAWTMVSDAQGRTTQVDTNAAVGTDGTQTAERTLRYGYDNAGRLTDVTDTRGDVCQDRAYGFDSDGNRTAQTTTTVTGEDCTVTANTTAAVTKTWTYDSADRITKDAAVHAVVTTTDDGGNATTATTDTGGATAYTYDALGRVTTLPAGDTPAAQSAEATGQPVAAGDVSIGYYDTDAARTTSAGGTTTTYGLDPAGRRGTSTVTKSGADTVSTVMDFGDDSDNPSYATQTVGTNAPIVSVYGSSIGGDLGFNTTGDTATLDLADPHGDTITTMTIPTAGNLALLASPIQAFDEYGNTCTDLTTTGDDGNLTDGSTTTSSATGAIHYGALGAKQRATDTTGLTLMGARLYNPTTGQFTSTDPVAGGNSTAYAYPQDPINSFDLNGQWGWRKAWHRTTHWVSKHRRGLTHFGLSLAWGIGTGLAVGALCAGTAGFGCAVGAGVAISMWQVPGHLAIDRAYHHKTSGREAIGYLRGSIQNGIKGPYQSHYVTKPLWHRTKSYASRLKFW
ncbi:RHS repeat-associated core domain-containing protein [Luteimicrobium subarcticum]|uniref:RHS repeat-associated core domain-containing protein n=1 Tax=Luteimicrobium subarcticum TaxID=620910 RepID=UPI000C242085|nr:RHS repeat-associated core domain-containing protein [Luteimicrobium subarcticum]